MKVNYFGFRDAIDHSVVPESIERNIFLRLFCILLYSLEQTSRPSANRFILPVHNHPRKSCIRVIKFSSETGNQRHEHDYLELFFFLDGFDHSFANLLHHSVLYNSVTFSRWDKKLVFNIDKFLGICYDTFVCFWNWLLHMILLASNRPLGCRSKHLTCLSKFNLRLHTFFLWFVVTFWIFPKGLFCLFYQFFHPVSNLIVSFINTISISFIILDGTALNRVMAFIKVLKKRSMGMKKIFFFWFLIDEALVVLIFNIFVFLIDFFLQRVNFLKVLLDYLLPDLYVFLFPNLFFLSHHSWRNFKSRPIFFLLFFYLILRWTKPAQLMDFFLFHIGESGVFYFDVFFLNFLAIQSPNHHSFQGPLYRRILHLVSFLFNLYSRMKIILCIIKTISCLHIMRIVFLTFTARRRLKPTFSVFSDWSSRGKLLKDSIR